MTTLAPPLSLRLLDSGAGSGALPRLDLPGLVDLAETCGLTGRGGAGFPAAVKLRAVADGARAPVVVGNALEGEPLSSKDAFLLERAPELVLDGVALVAHALGAKRSVIAVGPEVPAVGLEQRARARGIEVRRLEGGFVAGQETALLRQLAGGPALPRDPLVRVVHRGLHDRPTFVGNVETLAHLALAARHGAQAYRSVGTQAEPGTTLVTISGAVESPGVREVARGMPLREVLAPAGPRDLAAVLVGGFHGSWLGPEQLDVPYSRAGLAPYGARPGAGVLHVLDTATCPVRLTADIARYLARESTGQCGPCVNGLPALADAWSSLAAGRAPARGALGVDALQRLVTGRGACAHPDGTAAMSASAMRVFADHVEAHRAGRCPTYAGAAR